MIPNTPMRNSFVDAACAGNSFINLVRSNDPTLPWAVAMDIVGLCRRRADDGPDFSASSPLVRGLAHAELEPSGPIDIGFFKMLQDQADSFNSVNSFFESDTLIRCLRVCAKAQDADSLLFLGHACTVTNRTPPTNLVEAYMSLIWNMTGKVFKGSGACGPRRGLEPLPNLRELRNRFQHDLDYLQEHEQEPDTDPVHALPHYSNLLIQSRYPKLGLHKRVNVYDVLATHALVMDALSDENRGSAINDTRDYFGDPVPPPTAYLLTSSGLLIQRPLATALRVLRHSGPGTDQHPRKPVFQRALQRFSREPDLEQVLLPLGFTIRPDPSRFCASVINVMCADILAKHENLYVDCLEMNISLATLLDRRNVTRIRAVVTERIESDFLEKRAGKSSRYGSAADIVIPQVPVHEPEQVPEPEPAHVLETLPEPVIELTLLDYAFERWYGVGDTHNNAVCDILQSLVTTQPLRGWEVTDKAGLADAAPVMTTWLGGVVAAAVAERVQKLPDTVLYKAPAPVWDAACRIATLAVVVEQLLLHPSHDRLVDLMNSRVVERLTEALVKSVLADTGDTITDENAFATLVANPTLPFEREIEYLCGAR